ncbi:hypothetical protein Nepgr_017120 [Nepenthes gracilis]|uniref:Glycosyltransferase n=1 Tax=Nepenthes gracilis TaxID=150966 RepID=A0AAD3SQY7_NEPGR|nr:hypothetical protein Nepgr_017120 [Nepenthes gracilis]
MAGERKLHMVMFPWLAFGHMIPFLELSKSLAKKGHHVSFVSTPRNIERLPKIPQNLAPLIDFVKLPLPAGAENLPPDAEATSDLHYDKVQFLKKAYDGLSGPLAEFLESSSPDWIVCDFSSHWLPPIAAKLGIPQAFFSIYPSRTLSFAVGPSDGPGTDLKCPEDFTDVPEWITFPTSPAFRLHEAKKFMIIAQENISGVSDVFRMASTLKGCDVIAPRSCLELEDDYINLLKEIHGKPVVPIGLLPPSVEDYADCGSDSDDSWQVISRWLDKHGKRSVVYIAFGSESTQSREELSEVALGLELSGLPFFWALKNPELPEGFEDRTNGRGLVWRSWAPQLRILSHESVGGFLTHSGWSSVIEALQFGLPLIILPFFVDQGLIARDLADRRVGIEVPRDEEDGSFTRDSVAESLRLVVVEEGGRPYREKAKEMSTLFGDRSLHDQYVDKFAEHLTNNCNIKK